MRAWLTGGVAGIAIGVAVALSAARWAGAVTQPVAFDHRKHTQDLKLDCALCHPNVEVGQHPGLPSVDICAMCHQTKLGTSSASAQVTGYVTSGRPLVFRKLFGLPPYVFFTHRRHVAIAKLPCADCHGDIALTTTPPRRPLVTITMNFCLHCHLKMHQSTDCIACHR